MNHHLLVQNNAVKEKEIFKAFFQNFQQSFHFGSKPS